MVLARLALLLSIAFISPSILAEPFVFEPSVSVLGTPASGQPCRTLRIDESTRHISVEQFEVVTITNDKGHSFTWKFDTGHVPTGFPLRKVAPPGFEAGLVWVHVGYARGPGR